MSVPLRSLLAALVLACGTGGVAQAQQPPATAPVPVIPVPPAGHPSIATGWARFTIPGGLLYAAPDPASPVTSTVASARVAGRTLGVAYGTDRGVWVRVGFGAGRVGWAPGEAVVAVPVPAVPAPATLRTLDRAAAALGPRGAVVVRDRFGRTVYAAGTRAPLSIASVTKLTTVTAALHLRTLPLAAARAILIPSDNRLAQLLSNRNGGGSAHAGALLATVTAAGFGASFHLVDGSGLSPANRASAGEVADLLLGIRDMPRFRTLYRALPVAGRTGTLVDRMGGSAAEGRLRAKTGSLFDHPASSLAGYLSAAGSGTSPDRALILVVLENRLSPYTARPLQDTIAVTLAAPGAFVAG